MHIDNFFPVINVSFVFTFWQDLILMQFSTYFLLPFLNPELFVATYKYM